VNFLKFQYLSFCKSFFVLKGTDVHRILAMDPNYRMNVAALKKVDPTVDNILDSATHVAMYTFNSKDNKWEKTEIEGALFVYTRSVAPNHAFIIMNRLNTNNLLEFVNEGLDFQIKEPFLLYKTNRAQIYGIWFYDKNECYRVTSNMQKLVKSLQGMNGQKEKRKDGVGGVDIFSMLSKAQEDFNIRTQPEKVEKKKISEKLPIAPKPTVGTLLPGLPTPPGPSAPINTPQSVMDFFAKASNTQFPTPENEANKVMKPPANILPGFFQQPPPQMAQPPIPIRMQPPQQAEENMKPILMRLMSNPVHSVEHIEKQQRSLTPDSKNTNTEPQQHSHGNTLENGMRFLHMSPAASNTVLFGTPPSASVLASVVERPLSASLGADNQSMHQKQPALIPPTMFAAPVRTENQQSKLI
jgi:mRNA-decapping enzyme 1B